VIANIAASSEAGSGTKPNGRPAGRYGSATAASATISVASHSHVPGRLKDAGVTLFTIGFGTTVDADLLTSMASTPDLYFEAPSEAELADVYREIARRITAVRLLKRATVTDELPVDMVYENGSAVPPARVNGRTLTWDLVDVPATGRALTYRVRPLQTGRRPTNVRAVLDYIDAGDQVGQSVFPVPEITVIRRAVWDAYLPILYKNRCQPQRADVVLAIDASSSMTEPERPGSATTKRDAAIRSARSFVGAMEFPGDQASIVSFNSAARVVEPLTGSRAALNFALNGLVTGQGTRIDLGLKAATAELLSGRHKRLNNPVIVLLTDGQPSAGTEGAVLSAARDARGLGFTVFAVGLGSDADMSILSLIAGKSDRAFFAPDAAALASIYDRIAGKVLCEP